VNRRVWRISRRCAAAFAGIAWGADPGAIPRSGRLDPGFAFNAADFVKSASDVSRDEGGLDANSPVMTLHKLASLR
jgi:hypothetical protein